MLHSRYRLFLLFMWCLFILQGCAGAPAPPLYPLLLTEYDVPHVWQQESDDNIANYIFISGEERAHAARSFVLPPPLEGAERQPLGHHIGVFTTPQHAQEAFDAFIISERAYYGEGVTRPQQIIPSFPTQADTYTVYCGMYVVRNGATLCMFIGRYGVYLTTLSAYVGDPLTPQEFVQLQQMIEQRILQAEHQQSP